MVLRTPKREGPTTTLPTSFSTPTVTPRSSIDRQLPLCTSSDSSTSTCGLRLPPLATFPTPNAPSSPSPLSGSVRATGKFMPADREQPALALSCEDLTTRLLIPGRSFVHSISPQVHAHCCFRILCRLTGLLPSHQALHVAPHTAVLASHTGTTLFCLHPACSCFSGISSRTRAHLISRTSLLRLHLVSPLSRSPARTCDHVCCVIRLLTKCTIDVHVIAMLICERVRLSPLASSCCRPQYMVGRIPRF